MSNQSERKKGVEGGIGTNINKAKNCGNYDDKYHGTNRNPVVFVDLYAFNDDHSCIEAQDRHTCEKKAGNGKPRSRAKAQVSRDAEAMVPKVLKIKVQTSPHVIKVVATLDPVAA